MKRVLACMLALALALALCPALAEDAQDQGEERREHEAAMKVINCEEWVSLRAKPDADSERLAKVPLGATVTDCSVVEGGFVQCTYEDVNGYILEEFLEAVPVEEPGELALDAEVSGMRVLAERKSVDGGECMLVSCQTANEEEVWSWETKTTQLTELSLTAAFIGGTLDAPLVLIYNAERGLWAFDLKTGEECWMLGKGQVNLGASISCAVGADGTAYIGGFYGPHPVAIAANGRVLWQANGDSETYWLFGIELRSEGIAAHYDVLGGDIDQSGWVIYGWDGGVLRTEPDGDTESGEAAEPDEEIAFDAAAEPEEGAVFDVPAEPEEDAVVGVG